MAIQDRHAAMRQVVLTAPTVGPAKPEQAVAKTGTFYKVVAHDGCDLYTGEFSYPQTVGMTAYISGEHATRTPEACSNTVLHASPTMCDAIRFGVNLIWSRGSLRTTPPKFFRAFELYGTPVVVESTNGKYGFREFDVEREITDRDELARLVSKSKDGTKRLASTAYTPGRKVTLREARVIVSYLFDPKQAFTGIRPSLLPSR